MYHGTDIKIGKVDCTLEEFACDHMEMDGFPGLYFLRGNYGVEYNMSRSFENLTLYLENKYYLNTTSSFWIPKWEEVPTSILGRMYREFSWTVSLLFGVIWLNWLPPPV